MYFCKYWYIASEFNKLLIFFRINLKTCSTYNETQSCFYVNNQSKLTVHNCDDAIDVRIGFWFSQTGKTGIFTVLIGGVESQLNPAVHSTEFCSGRKRVESHPASWKKDKTILHYLPLNGISVNSFIVIRFIWVTQTRIYYCIT